MTLFGAPQNSNQNQSQGTGLFGASTNQTQTGGTGLFGSSNTQNQTQGTGLFRSNSNTQNQTQGTGLFGGSTNQPQQQQQNTGLFGSSTTQNQPQQQQGTGLFGSAQPQPNTGLFGASTAQPQQQQQTTGLFGASATQNQPQQQQQSNAFSNSLFANSTNQQPNPNPNASLFPTSQPQRTAAERTFPHPQQTHLSSLLQSGLGGNPSAFGTLGTTSQTDLARSRLAAAGITAIPNEKSVIEQVQTLVRKWDPNSQDTLIQKYLYNAVNAAYAPFYYRNAEESEREWEEALSKKPAPVENKDGDNVAFVPVLVRGFKALGERVEYQARTVNEMRARLHEMNNSLNAIMATHQQSITVRLENARRQHAALSQRCLRLAVKAQVLRNRGYPLDVAEESLRKSLQGLEAKVFDPQYSAREEEVWARMVALRDRARWLEEEGKRIAAQQNASGGQGGGGKKEGMSDEVVAKTKKVLADYEGQIRHLGRELEEVRREFGEWEDLRR